MKTSVVVKVIKPVPVPPAAYQLTINLSQRDAEALCALVSRIGGSPSDSARNLFCSIYDELVSVGVKADADAIDLKSSKDGTIYFKDYKTYT